MLFGIDKWAPGDGKERDEAIIERDEHYEENIEHSSFW